MLWLIDITVLSQELLLRGDRTTAGRLALYVVDMAEDEWSVSSHLGSTLAAARGDEGVLTWGLEADGSTPR
jgi:hypothetical protein